MAYLFFSAYACIAASCIHNAWAGAGPELMKNEVNPVGKVIELLDVLMKQLHDDGTTDGKIYTEQTALYNNVSSNAKRIIKETKAELSTLSTGIDEQKTVVEGLQRTLEITSGELTTVEQDLKEAQETRKKERAAFEENEATLVHAVDQLERAIGVLGASMPASTPASALQRATSLATVARRLRTVFSQEGAVQLTASQRETLNAFFRDATKDSHETSTWHRLRSKSRTPTAFLQVGDTTAAKVSGEVAESANGGVEETLKSALETSQKELDKARDVESNAMLSFTSIEGDMKVEIANKEKTISQTKQQTSQAQQAISQMEAKELEAKEVLKSSETELAEAEEEQQRRAFSFKERVSKRSDEILAAREASQLLTSEAAKQVLQKYEGDKHSSETSFLQVAADRATPIALRLMRKANVPGLALLALRAHTAKAKRNLNRGGADPFAKVKTLIRDMLQKLQEEQSKEAEKKAWCDSEMGKSTKQKESKEAYIEKLSDRIDAMKVEVEDLTKDLEMHAKDLDDLQKATIQATDIRTEEREHATVAIQQYKDAVELIGTAIKVLAKVYKKGGGDDAAALVQTTKDTEAEDPVDKEHIKGGLGKGIIGILEIAQQDFADILQETEDNERASQQEYKQLMSESEVRVAVFKKDIEYKEREKVKLQSEIMHTSSDKESFEKELDAVVAYLDQLKSQCIAKAETYEDRKARREQELAALKEAQEYLSSEA
jgi:hypothetical protein